MSSWKQRVAARFDAAAAAETYDAAARVQRLIAEDLAVRVSGLHLPEHPRVLEVGCGTGFLTAALVERLPEPHVTATDIAPSMVRATARLELPGVSTHVMDGEDPDAPAERFDLVCTSLAAQWFADLPGAVEKLMRCVKPGGYLAVATLGADTFHEWRAAARETGIDPFDRGYPTAERLADMMGEGAGVDELSPVVSSSSGHAFLRDLKSIGAHTRAEGQEPLTAGQLRRILRRLEAVDGQVYSTYHVLFGIRRKAGHGAEGA
ncbi:methyltransferase domain-containing protein [Caenispirillum salinarum]|uniref:methyltransferase domain-containing protein n=1 Tax=Caenispirillum salinarum TaxID=859058 RepID=UPI00384D71A2